MLILLYGEDTYRSRQKINQIIEQYKARHKTGLNLARFEERELDFNKIKEKIEVFSIFNEKKLLILDNPFKNKDFQEKFIQYAKKNKLKNNQDVIVVIHQQGKLAVSKIKSQINMLEEFKPLTGQGLVNWIKKEIEKKGGKIDLTTAGKMAAYVGNDLWRMSNEINKLLNYMNNQPITEKEVDLLVGAKADINIFKTLDALACRNKRIAFKLLREHLNEGENEIFVFTMFVYQLRNLIKLKDLAEKGNSFYDLSKKSGLHPFVVKKSWQMLKNFELERLKAIYRRLLNIEFKLKTGQIDGPVALDLLIMEI